MFRSFTAFVLIATLLTANLTRLFVYAGYEMNKNYIAAKLCENRDKPQMHCEGKCYLAKKIKQAEEKEKANERDAQKNHFQEAFIAQNSRIIFSALLLRVINSQYTSPVSHQHDADIFQPPQV
ncbi:MAG: hypothetical protein EOP47_19100 [Sphingobacteriaceae bacterium]|nr:MAG: hypothetical protein EOP47_19100 [Sphingobacteriaceae bacterium]